MDNPPAFPQVGNPTWGMEPSPGMTLRDWFAGQAPVTLFDAAVACGWSAIDAADMPRDDYRATLWAVMTLMRYEYADAMLAARATPAAPAAEMQHVAYYDAEDRQFRWMSGIAPRACDLFAARTNGGQSNG